MATLFARASSSSIIHRLQCRSLHSQTSDLERLVRSRCKSGDLSLEEAMAHFKALTDLRPLPSVGVFNRLFGSVYNSGNFSDVVLMFKALTKFSDFSPEISTLNYIVNCYCRLGREDLGFSVYAVVVKLGFHWDNHTLSIILRELCCSSSMAAAIRLTEDMVRYKAPGYEFSYAIVINGLCKSGEISKALEILKKMFHGKRVKPDSGCFSPVINAFFDQNRPEEALGLFDAMASLKVSPDSATCNSLIRGLCRSKRWSEAEKFLTDFRLKYGFYPNTRTYNILLDCLCKAERTDKALLLFDRFISSGLKPNVVSFNSLFSGLARRGMWDQVSELSKTMESLGVCPDQSTVSPIVDALCKEKKVSKALDHVEEMTRKGVTPNSVIYNSIIHGFCISGRWRKGLKVLDQMNDQGIKPCCYTFHILVYALCKHNKETEAFKLYKYMVEIGLVPDERLKEAYASLLGKFSKGAKTLTPSEFPSWSKNNGTKF